MILQNTKRAVELMLWLGLARAQFKVDSTIMPSSMPHIRRRPNTIGEPAEQHLSYHDACALVEALQGRVD